MDVVSSDLSLKFVIRSDYRNNPETADLFKSANDFNVGDIVSGAFDGYMCPSEGFRKKIVDDCVHRIAGFEHGLVYVEAIHKISKDIVTSVYVFASKLKLVKREEAGMSETEKIKAGDKVQLNHEAIARLCDKNVIAKHEQHKGLTFHVSERSAQGLLSLTSIYEKTGRTDSRVRVDVNACFATRMPAKLTAKDIKVGDRITPNPLTCPCAICDVGDVYEVRSIDQHENCMTLIRIAGKGGSQWTGAEPEWFMSVEKTQPVIAAASEAKKEEPTALPEQLALPGYLPSIIPNRFGLRNADVMWPALKPVAVAKVEPCPTCRKTDKQGYVFPACGGRLPCPECNPDWVNVGSAFKKYGNIRASK